MFCIPNGEQHQKDIYFISNDNLFQVWGLFAKFNLIDNFTFPSLSGCELFPGCILILMKSEVGTCGKILASLLVGKRIRSWNRSFFCSYVLAFHAAAKLNDPIFSLAAMNLSSLEYEKILKILQNRPFSEAENLETQASMILEEFKAFAFDELISVSDCLKICTGISALKEFSWHTSKECFQTGAKNFPRISNAFYSMDIIGSLWWKKHRSILKKYPRLVSRAMLWLRNKTSFQGC